MNYVHLCYTFGARRSRRYVTKQCLPVVGVKRLRRKNTGVSAHLGVSDTPDRRSRSARREPAFGCESLIGQSGVGHYSCLGRRKHRRQAAYNAMLLVTISIPQARAVQIAARSGLAQPLLTSYNAARPPAIALSTTYQNTRFALHRRRAIDEGP